MFHNVKRMWKLAETHWRKLHHQIAVKTVINTLDSGNYRCPPSMREVIYMHAFVMPKTGM